MRKVGLAVMGPSVELHEYYLEIIKRARLAWQQERETRASEPRASEALTFLIPALLVLGWSSSLPGESEMSATSCFLSL